jgi:hypothetical protein
MRKILFQALFIGMLDKKCLKNTKAFVFEILNNKARANYELIFKYLHC